MPSWALRFACVKPPICDFIFSEIAKPAASSPALLIREPDESFANEFDFAVFAAVKRLYVFIAATFVLIRMLNSSISLVSLTDYILLYRQHDNLFKHLLAIYSEKFSFYITFLYKSSILHCYNRIINKGGSIFYGEITVFSLHNYKKQRQNA